MMVQERRQAMKGLGKLFMISILSIGLTAAIPVMAQMGRVTKPGMPGIMHPGEGMMGHKMGTKMMGHPGKHGPGHLFGPHWKKTLTDEQKMQADRMHLALKKEIRVLEARLNVEKTELSNLVVQDSPDTKAIHRKIDGVIELKREIMQKKYNHIIEMRGMLTKEQRVSFDMGVLKKDKHGKGHGRQ